MWKITALLYLCIYMTVIGSQHLYPPSWNPFCDVFNSTEFINISCNLKPEDSLRLQLKNLNEYTNNTADNVKYSVYWKCSPNASVSMRAPMQINKLYSLKVSGCRIFEYYKDWNHQSLGKIKDSIVYYELVDSIIMVDIIPHMLFLGNFKKVSNDWMCGPDTTIRQYILRNISVDLVKFNRSELIKFIRGGNVAKVIKIIDLISTVIPDLFLINSKIMSLYDFHYHPQCSFQNLEVLENVMNEALTDKIFIFKSVDAQFPNMRVFNYSHNGFTDFHKEWIRYMYKFPKLEYIDYSYNFIADIPRAENLYYTRRQVVIDLSYNNITTLTTDTVSKWAQFPDVTVNIRGNPLDCGCFKQDFIFKVQDDKFFDGKMQKYKYFQNMKCASPATAKGIKLINLSKAEMGCDIPPEDLTIYLVGIGVTAAILILAIILVFVYQKEIKLLLYVNFNILLPCDVDKYAEQKRFDAFISYSSSDSDWVLDTLLHNLESPFDSHDAFSLCIHERDFIGGKSILLNIIDSIENSRHTIVVLSRQFMQNVWTMAEFKEAYEESVTKKRRHLIIIKYQDIPEAEMDSMLKRCIKTFTYIDVKDPRFLDRLRFSLAIKCR